MRLNCCLIAAVALTLCPACPPTFAGSAKKVIAVTGELAPTGNGRYSSFSIEGPAINEAGQIAFYASLSETSARRALIRSDGTTTVEIVREGTPLPEGGGTFGPDFIGPPLINDSGQVRFLTLQNRGIYRGDGSSTVTIASSSQPTPSGNGSTGDAMLGSTISQLALEPTSGLVGDERGGINDLGQVAFYAQLADGRKAIIVATVPEPSGAALLITLLVVYVRRGRKSEPAGE